MTTPLIAFYGDDLTGSTDVMESLSMRGIETVLFTDLPTDAQLARFPDARAIGIAGTSRSETPAWMDANLPGVFEWLKARGAAITHYKICSTFDSSPAIGSIGRAAEIGRRVFGDRPVPLVVGAPQLKRWTAFGNLFAAYRGETFRIDRHPVMSRHPVTPMREADLRLHLAEQTPLPVALLDTVALLADDADARIDAILAHDPGLVLIDVLDAATQSAAGRQLARLAEAGCRFAVGSSGVEYALAAHWATIGRLAGPPPSSRCRRRSASRSSRAAARRPPRGRSGMRATTGSSRSPSIRAPSFPPIRRRSRRWRRGPRPPFGPGAR